MDLILWRHAEAVAGYPDLARQLTEKGHKQAEKMAAFLKNHLPAGTRVLSSPAIRTRQTVAALTKHYTVIPSIAPDASVDAVLQAANWPDGEDSVLIVGHQPTLGAVAAHLLNSTDTSLRVKKGNIWWFSRNSDSSEVTLRLVMSPELL